MAESNRTSLFVSTRSTGSLAPGDFSTPLGEETKEPEGDEQVTPPETTSETDNGQDNPADAAENQQEDGLLAKIYKSTRLKGYITLVLGSAINYDAARISSDPSFNNAVAATNKQRRYAVTVAIFSLIVALATVIAHTDRCTPLKRYWDRAFQPKSRFELGLLLFLLIWWIIATWIQTSVRGVAGDGKGQYNLYFSTWACLWTTIWTLERWMVKAGLSSIRTFMASWPNRAPGWIAIFVFSLATLMCYLDLYLNWENATRNEVTQIQFESVADAQWTWLLFVTSISVPSSLGFVLVEIFRESKPISEPQQQGTTDSSTRTTFVLPPDGKSELETVLEGFTLLILFLAWIPSLILATSPGGIASLVGNSYFFTWAATIFVAETSVWWVHDWRKRMHSILQAQEEEYRRIQEEVLLKSRESAASRDQEEQVEGIPDHRRFDRDGGAEDDDDDDDQSEFSDYNEVDLPVEIGS